MSEAENIEKVVTALLRVPPKELLIIQLVNTIPIVNGELDYAVVTERQLEINLAAAEAKAYGSHTLMAVDVLFRLRASKETPDVGP